MLRSPGEASLAILGEVSSHLWVLVRLPRQSGQVAPHTTGSTSSTASPLCLEIPTFSCACGLDSSCPWPLGLGWLPTPFPFLLFLCLLLTESNCPPGRWGLEVRERMHQQVETSNGGKSSATWTEREEQLFDPSKWQADPASLPGRLVSRVIPTGQERIEAGETPRVGSLREKDNKKNINSFKLIALTAKTQS